MKAEILFFLLLIKLRGHNYRSSGAPSLVMLTAPLSHIGVHVRILSAVIPGANQPREIK